MTLSGRISSEHYDADLPYFEMMSEWLVAGRFAERVDNLLSVVDPIGPVVLDAGCGVGTFAIECAYRGCQVAALDFSATALSFCLQNAQQYGVQGRITFVQSPAEQLPFDDNSFDTVIAADIVEHIYESQAFFREMRRVLKPGGKLV